MVLNIRLTTTTHKQRLLSSLASSHAPISAGKMGKVNPLTGSFPPGQLVILDHLRTHLGEKVRQAIEAREYQFLFLPSYSPDLSPMEEAFSKLKTFFRLVGARTPEALQEAIGQALLTIPIQGAHEWFGHCGYRPVDVAGEGRSLLSPIGMRIVPC